MHRKSVDIWVARLLMVSFFLPMALQVIAVLLVAGYFTIDRFLNKAITPKINYYWPICLSALFYLYVAWIPVTPSSLQNELGMLCQHRLSYLLFPFFFAIMTPDKRALIRSQLLWFVFGCAACCIIANVVCLYHFYFSTETVQQVFHVQYRLYLEQVTSIHPTYLSMFIGFSICILLLDKDANINRWVKYGLLYLLLVFLFTMLAKSVMLALLVVMVHYAFLNRKLLWQYKFQIVGICAAIAVALYFIPFFGQRMGEVLQFAGIGTKGGDVTDNSVYVRKLVWNTDIDLLKRYWLCGTGPAILRFMLKGRYFFFSIEHNFPVGYYDPHNEYLSEWLSFGIIGIVVLVATLLVHAAAALKRRDYLYCYLLAILYITFFTETVLARQAGIIFYAVFTSLFFFTSKQQGETV